MQAYDLFMIIVLVAATLFGLWKGLAWQVASLSSIFLSYFVAHTFSDQLANMLTTAAPWNKFLAMLILFIGTSLVVWLAFRYVSEAIDRVKLKEFDHQIGALLGIAKGVLLCVIITLFAVTLSGEEQRQQIISSRSGYYIAVLLDRSHAVMPPEVHDPYIHSLDHQLSDEERQFGHDHEHDSENAYQQDGSSYPPQQANNNGYPAGEPTSDRYANPAPQYNDTPAPTPPRTQGLWETARDALFKTEQR
jgi:membrane protein required for colicin V production